MFTSDDDMQDPRSEIEAAVLSITAATNADTQQAAILRYFAPDASFRHPLCTVRGSRESILRVYQWYRVLSPQLRVRVQSVIYDEARGELWLDVVQTFHIWLSLFRPAHSRLHVHLILRKLCEPDGKPLYVIATQEDFYHPEDLMALLVPPLVPVVHFLLLLGTLASILGARLGALLGWWAAGPREVPHKALDGAGLMHSQAGRKSEL